MDLAKNHFLNQEASQKVSFGIFIVSRCVVHRQQYPVKLYWVGSGKGGVYATLPLPRCVVPLCILCTHDEINVTWMRGVLQLRLLKLWLQAPKSM